MGNTSIILNFCYFLEAIVTCLLFFLQYIAFYNKVLKILFNLLKINFF